MHKVCELYKQIYFISGKINKKDKYGLWLKIENICLEVIYLATKAALTNKNNKLVFLESARTEIEILKRLIRIACDILIIQTKTYLQLESNLQEISKMANGWIKYLTQKEQ